MPDRNPLLDQTRRHFFKDCAIGLGGIALSEMLNGSNASASSIGGLHHKPKAKNVIFLFMAGGPSQLDLFDEKPEFLGIMGITFIVAGIIINSFFKTKKA